MGWTTALSVLMKRQMRRSNVQPLTASYNNPSVQTPVASDAFCPILRGQAAGFLFRQPRQLHRRTDLIMNPTEHQREPWNPFRELTELRDEINRVYQEGPGSNHSLDSHKTWQPAVEVYSDKEKLVVTVELPGMNKENIEISVEGNQLCICGERRPEKVPLAEGELHQSERRYGRFVRTLTLLQNVDSERIDARYRDGILKITLPKAEPSERKQIEVRTA